MIRLGFWLLAASSFALPIAAAPALAASANCAEDLSQPAAGKAMALDGARFRFIESGLCVQLWALDTPGFFDMHGPDTRSSLEAIIAGRTLTCEPVGIPEDDYLLATCKREDGQDVGEAQLRAGGAYTDRWQLHGPLAEVYIAAEAEARAAKRGEWRDDSDGAKAYADWRAWVEYKSWANFGVMLGAWQSLVGALLAALIAAATILVMRSTTAAMIRNEQQLRRDEEERQKNQEVLRKWTILIDLQTELESLKRKLVESENFLKMMIGQNLISPICPVIIMVPRVYDFQATTLSDLGMGFGRAGSRRMGDFRSSLGDLWELMDRPFQLSQDGQPVYEATWARAMLDRIEIAQQRAAPLERKLAKLVASLDEKPEESWRDYLPDVPAAAPPLV